MKNRTSVLHLVNGEQYSGLERVVDHLIEAGSHEGFRSVLVLLKPGVMRARMSSREALVHELPMRSRFDLSIVSKVATIAADSECRLVHSHTVRSALVARRVQCLTRLPWVHHVHSPALHESKDLFRNLANFLLEARLLRHADSVLTVSEGLSAYVSRRYGVDADRVSVVPNGVRNRASSPPVQALEKPVIILTAALFRPRKGLEHLVDAAALLRGFNFKLRLAGEFESTSYESKIRDRVAQLKLDDKVEFLGFVTNMEAALEACDIFAFPSLYGEGMPMAVLEAMAMARPVVGSHISGVRELLDEGAGLLVPPGSAESLAAALSRLISEPMLRMQLAFAGQARQRRCHSVQDADQRVLDLYRDLVGRAPSGRLRTLPS